jgi:hypothetical protein
MDDRELLDLALKAAGKNGMHHPEGGIVLNGGFTRWNPLTDDGDALRLATKLRLNIEYMDGADSVAARHDEAAVNGAYAVEALDDFGVRRAIVRAAAAVGRAME